MKLSLTGKLAKLAICLAFSWVLLATNSWASYSTSSPALQLIYTSLQSYYPQAKLKHQTKLDEIYSLTEYNYLWLAPNKQLNLAALALKEDLQPWLYLSPHPKLESYQEIIFLLNQLPFIDLPRQRLAADLWLTDLFLSYQEDLLTRYWPKQDEDEDHGIVNKYEDWSHLPNPTPESSLDEVFPAWLSQLKTSSSEKWLTNLLLASRPNAEFYKPLHQAFTQFKQLEKQASWPKITANLYLGIEHPEITSLALQLYYHQDLANYEDYLATNEEPPKFDAQLKDALVNFQLRHNLSPTGTTNQQTLAWLNLEPQARLKILAANLKRLHHLPKQLHPRHLMLNMANQELSYMNNNKEELSMKIIVGRPGQRTPIMNQWLTSLVLNPIWNVPTSLAKNSILPRALKNPNYLDSNNYELLEGWHTPNRKAKLTKAAAKTFGQPTNPLRIIQKSGSNNQLGKVKFRLSNQQAIYLHDTPFRQGFNNQQRNLSSGCVRLENAEGLVEKLLELTRYNSDQLNKIYSAQEERYLQLNSSVAVYLMYWTVTSQNGQLNWFTDLYKKDTWAETTTQLAQQQAN